MRSRKPSEAYERIERYAAALWIVFSHAHDGFDVSPRLVAKSPQKRSGKSTLFNILFRLVAKPKLLSGITASALLRVIEIFSPTMLVDEIDAVMSGDKEVAQALRGLLNAGFNRAGAKLIMSVPTREGYEPREFSCWAPVALAGIGKLPDTVRDRSIELEMKRKLPSERVKKLRRRDGAELHELARKLVRWAEDNMAALRTAVPAMPEGLNDRAADAWEPLVAIADRGRENPLFPRYPLLPSFQSATRYQPQKNLGKRWFFKALRIPTVAL